MKIITNIFRYSGILGISIYVMFTLISYCFYPLHFSPCGNWLSDLGNPLKNPVGAHFYNIGCIMISFLAMIFYIGMDQWNSLGRKRKLSFLIAQFAGVFSSWSLLITALFPLGSYTDIHDFWSTMLYIGLGFFELFLGLTIFTFPKAGKWLGYYGILAMSINFITLVYSIFDFFIGEWIAVALFFIYIIVITWQYDRFYIR